jgi:hypothetical protein
MNRTHTPEDIKAIMNEYDADYNYERDMRNRTLEEVALEIDKMKVFEADTMASIAAFVRDMKR